MDRSSKQLRIFTPQNAKRIFAQELFRAGCPQMLGDQLHHIALMQLATLVRVVVRRQQMNQPFLQQSPTQLL